MLNSYTTRSTSTDIESWLALYRYNMGKKNTFNKLSWKEYLSTQPTNGCLVKLVLSNSTSAHRHSLPGV